MKQQDSIQTLALELTRQAKSKRDFIAPSDRLTYHPKNGDPESLELSGIGRFAITDHTHGQLSDRLGIPKKYYDRMRTEAPELLAHNLNTWFTKKPEPRLIRTMDGHARAYLSERYRPLDHVDLAEAILPRLMAPDLKLESLALTPSKMYLKATSPKLEGEVKKGDVVQAGIVISNSEVGLGSVKVEPMVFRLVCLNGLITGHALSKYHVGKGLGDGGDDLAREFFRDETRRLDDAAFYAKVRDVVEGALSEAGFQKMLTSLQATTEHKITGDPVQVVEVTAQRFGLSDEERGGVLNALIEGSDLSQWGLVNAITRMSQHVASYDRASELERLGGNVIELAPSEWKALTESK